MKNSGIYKITEKSTGFMYIGQSVDIARRFREHKLGKNNYGIDLVISEKGVENFDFEIIEYCNPEFLNEKDKYWIKYYNSNKDGYNLRPGGTSTRHVYGEKVNTAILTNEEVLQYRKEYTNEPAESIYNKHNLQEKISYISFERAIMGRTFKFLPIYKKRQNIWIPKPGYDCSNYPLRNNKIDSTGTWRNKMELTTNDELS